MKIIDRPSILIKSRGHIGFHFCTKPFVHKSELWSYTLDSPSIEQKFVYYYLLTKQAYFNRLARATSVKLPQLSIRDTDTFKVPVPPLEVQQKIVEILDSFTQLEAELEAELEARELQFKSVLGRLFIFPDSIPYKQIQSVCLKVSSGGTPLTRRSDYYDGDIPWVRTQDVDFNRITEASKCISEAGLNNSSANWIPKHSVIVAMYGATAAKVAINEIPVTTNQACCNLQVDPTKADYRYVFYYLIYQYEKLKSLGVGSQSNLNATKIKNYPIPIPSLETQQKIVEILDSLDFYTKNLRYGLPAELAARRQQYEYYRDQLLTFKELEA